ncbi:death domain-containing protein CRADD [Spinachia spinachia]
MIDVIRTGRPRFTMDPDHRALLRTHRLQLSGQLLVSDTIVPLLYQEDILSEAQVEEIESQPTNRHKCLKLLDLLPSRGPRAFDCFLRSLEDFSWVRDQLLHVCSERMRLRLPDSLLQVVPPDRVLSRLASRLGSEWESVLLDLGLSTEDLFRCRSDHRLSTHAAALAGLVQWRRCGGKTATVQRLAKSLQEAGVHPSVLEEVLL